MQDLAEDSFFNPWRYMSKRFDPDLRVINFGRRFYDPHLARWLSTDPEGTLDSNNLYQYVFNNPFRFQDPDGGFVIAIPLLIWGAEVSIPALSTILAPSCMVQ
jgi:RHS repeat-associated protein